MIQTIGQSILEWLLAHGPRILIVIAIGIIVYVILKRFITIIIATTVRRTYDDQDIRGVEKRAQTLSDIFQITGKTLIILIVLLLILPELGINAAALLAGAGIIGLAVSIGAQGLIRDIIAGLFILMEDQYRVGDWVRFTGTGYDSRGKVESISLRKTVIRGLDGVLHFISHGDTARVSNLTKGISRASIKVCLSYEADLLKAEKLINDVGKDLSNDAKYGPLIITPPEFLGVEDLEGGKVTLIILGETQPGRQWEVATEFRTRIKMVFSKEGIEMR